MKLIIVLYTIVFLSHCTLSEKPKRYLLYDCNPGEGFNLRRDVYIRITNLVRQLNEADVCKGIKVISLSTIHKI